MAQENREVLAVIPARGGSKSIPRKNILDFAGHPLIAYSIAAAQQAETVTRTIVSTDDEEIAEVARRYGAEVPFMRPAQHAQDATPDFPVFEHALKWLAENEGYQPEFVIQLRPTTPVRPPDMIDEGVRILRQHPEVDSLRVVVPSGQNPHKMWRIGEDGRMSPLQTVEGLDEPYNAPRQKLPPTYWQTGHLDVIRSAVILEKGSMTGSVVMPLVLDPRYTVDIDTQADWEQAEWVLTQSGLPAVRPTQPAHNLPAQIDLIVLDFDGVLTDNRVWVDQNGVEQVAAHRGDGMGISMLKKAGYNVMILSTETNPVVAARAKKMDVPVYQGIDKKGAVLEKLLAEYGVNGENVVYVGNDINDLPCFPLVGCAAAVADAHPDVLAQADLVLETSGGFGAIRELADLILKK
ncbi:MAG TPA: acylneuraminate cytidylyltransferase [Anaerolineales bacterium]|nr:acylneuraminate cytidylyltransferase [Anaerolineales bacterium]